MKQFFTCLLTLGLVACGGEEDDNNYNPFSSSASFEITSELPDYNEHLDHAQPILINTSQQGQIGESHDIFDYYRVELEYGKVYKLTFNTNQDNGTRINILNSKHDILAAEKESFRSGLGSYSELIFAPFEDSEYWIEIKSLEPIPTLYQAEIVETDIFELSGVKASMCSEGIRYGAILHDTSYKLFHSDGDFAIHTLNLPGTCNLESVSAICEVTRDDALSTHYYNYNLVLKMGGFDSVKETFCDIHDIVTPTVTITTEFKVIKPLI